MTLAQLIDLVQIKIQDDSYTRATIRTYLNRACQWVASKVLLPDLQTEGRVYAGRAYLVASTISFNSSQQKILDSNAAFITSGFHVGDTVTVDGSTSNDGSYLVTAVTAEALTVSGALLDESAGAQITLYNQSPRYVPLPSDYMKNLYKCYNNSISSWIEVFPNHRVLMELFSRPDQSGDIRWVAPQGRTKLYYERLPSQAQALDLYYYRIPTPMVDYDQDSPDGIPEEFQHDILVNWVCKEIFSQIEDGIEGEKTNTAYHLQELNKAMAELTYSLGPENKPIYDPSLFGIDWGSYV